MNRLLILFLTMLTISGCKTNRFKDNKRVGLWIQKDTIDGSVYTSRGRFKNGIERKTWKYFKDDALYKKEVYGKSTCRTTFYHRNGSKMLEGQTNLVRDGKLLHWFYEGQWQEYDSTGLVVGTRLYHRGVLLSTLDK